MSLSALEDWRPEEPKAHLLSHFISMTVCSPSSVHTYRLKHRTLINILAPSTLLSGPTRTGWASFSLMQMSSDWWDGQPVELHWFLQETSLNFTAVSDFTDPPERCSKTDLRGKTHPETVAWRGRRRSAPSESICVDKLPQPAPLNVSVCPLGGASYRLQCS